MKDFIRQRTVGAQKGRPRSESNKTMTFRRKNKPFNFTELAKCAELCSQIQQEYDCLPRCSLLCHDLWAESSRVSAIIKYVENKIRLSYNLRLPQFYPSLFLELRKQEASQCLTPLKPALTDAYKFLWAFNSTRQAALKKDFGENSKVERKMAKHIKNYQKTLKALINESKNYKEFILTTLDAEEQAHFEIYFNEYFSQREPVTELAKNGAKQIAGDLENRMRKEKNLDYKRIAILVKALEDSNGLLNKPGVANLILDAKQKLKNYVDKPTFFGLFTKKEEVIPGIQDLGPLGLSPVPSRFNSRLELRDFDKTHAFVVELIDYILPNIAGSPADFKYEGKLSPLSTITGKRSHMLDREKVPEKARCYCFAYPIEGIDPKHVTQPSYENKPDSEAFKNFILFGGFLYFDEHNNFLHFNALDPSGTDIQFAGPFLLEKSELKILKRLQKKEEWANVTIPSLIRQGADRFAWLKPGELGKGNGSFVFSITADKQKYTYFDVVDISALPEAQLVKEAEEDTLFFNNVSLRFKSTRKKN